MDWIVTTARTVEEAQTRALDLLGVDTADAEIQVIEEGKTGLFGRTKSEARVRARIKPKAPAAKEERRPSRGGDRNRNRGSGSGSGGGGAKSSGNKGGQRQQGGGNRNRGGNRDGGKSEGGGRQSGGNRDGGNRDGGNRGGNKDAAETAAVGASAGGRGAGRDGGNRDGGGRDGGSRDGGGRSRNRGGNRGGGRDGGQRNDRGDRGSRNNEDRVEMPVDEQRETLQTFVTGVAQAFDADAKVVLVEEGTTLQAQVTGSGLGRLVGNKASTLQSFEELARTAMHRAAAGRRYHRIQVDVDEYRARRREALAKFATDLAKSVAESGESKAMEPMGAADRKLIHDAVADVDGVDTVSEGRDPRRYIVLLPNAASDEEE